MATHIDCIPACRAHRAHLAALAAAAIGLLHSAAQAQGGVAAASAPDAETAQTVTVTGARGPGASVLAGFGDAAPARSPFSLGTLAAATIKDLGLATPADLVRWDAAASDAYNATGYWSQFTLRGYLLDPRANLRRDGLPINGETAALAMEHLQAIHILKGASGIQAGTSTPGGLINLVVKRPGTRVRELNLGWREDASLSASADLSDRSGALAWRVNAAMEQLRPRQESARGRRHLLAAALELDAGVLGRAEFEFEHARQSQPSVPGFSLLGDRVPDAGPIDRNRNLNDQPWSMPVISTSDVASVRLSRRLGPQWTAQLHAMAQRLSTDDRIAFPFGCSVEGRFDRYCSDGTFDLYDFRSENERRRQDALELSLRNSSERHEFSAGLLASRATLRTQPQAFNYVGFGSIDRLQPVAANPDATAPNSLRDERGLEFFARGRFSIGEWAEAWAGLRASRLQRASRLTDGSQPIDYRQQLATPWLAVTTQWAGAMVYASWGQGAESAAVPNLPGVFANPGEVLPVQRSRQVEIGAKWRQASHEWSAALFDIRRPATSDLGARRQNDGVARHRGLELAWDGRAGAWSWHASAMALDAQRQDSVDPALNGLRPTNVPERSLRLQIAREVHALAGLQWHLLATHEGTRMALPDNSAAIPGWTRLDAGARLRQATPWGSLTWRLGIDNLLDRRAWKESPFQFGHAYLFPLPPRALRLSAQLTL